MKTTFTNLKKKLNARTNVKITGLGLKKNNPFWANKQQITYMRSTIEQIVQDGIDNPSKKYTVSETQLIKLNNYVDSLEREYLFA